MGAALEQSQQELTEARLKAKLMRDKIKTEAIREYQNSQEFRKYVEQKVTSRVEEVLSLVKVNELRQRNDLHNKLLAESAVLAPILQSPPAWERYLDIYKGISPLSDYLTYERFFETRHVPLWDCRGTVADICREFREEFKVGEILLPAIRQGIRYNVAEPGLPPQYVSAFQAATVREYSDARFEYSEDMMLQYKGEDPFLLYEDRRDLPNGYTEAEKDSHVSARFPNHYAPFFVEIQSAQRTGMEVITPEGVENLTPTGFTSLEVCHYPTYQTEYNSTRLSLRDAPKPMHCDSREEAIALIKQSLAKENLETLFPDCGRQDKIANGIEKTMRAIESKFVHHLCRIFSSLIKIRISAECMNTTFWFTRYFGEPDPCGKPPIRDKFAKAGEDNKAFLPGFDQSMEDQLTRFDMTRIAAIYHRSQILISQMFISFGIITNAYNSIMMLYSTHFSSLIMEFWHYDGEVPPELPRTMMCYYTLSGVMGYLAHTAAITARERTITRLQPVIDDLFKQLLTTSVYNKGPLYRNSLDLTPSKDAIVFIEQRLREKANRTQTAHHGSLSQPSVATSVEPCPNLPPELAAIYQRTTSQAPTTTLQTPRQTGTSSTQHTGRSMGTVGFETECNSHIITQRITNMSILSSAHTPISIHIGTEHPSNQSNGHQHVLVSHKRIGRPLGSGSPPLDAQQPRDDPGGRPIPGGLSSLVGQRGLGLRGLGLQQEEEKSREEGTSRAQHGSPQQYDLCCDAHGSETEEGGEKEETSGREGLTDTLSPQRRKRRRPRRGRKGPRYQPECDPSSTTSTPTLNTDVNASPMPIPNYMLPLHTDMLSLHDDATSNTVLCNDHPTITSNNPVCDVNANVTITPYTSLAPPPITNATLAALTSPIANIGVNNISSYAPSVDELRILALGLNFIPEPKDITNYEIYQALDEYTDSILWKEQLDYVGSSVHRDASNSAVSQLRRKLRAKLYHKRNTSENEYKRKERGYVKSFETNEYIHTIRQRFQADISNKRTKTHHTLSTQDSKDIQAILWDLKNNQMIVIKPADKNLGPTIMDRKWYIEAGELILTDSSTYRRIENFDINSIRNELIFILATSNHIKLNNTSPTEFMYKDWRNESLQTLKARYFTFSTDLADILLEPFLDPDGIQPCRSYFLPKLQKLAIPYPCPPPFIPGKTPPVRPICASIGWVTYIVSIYLDIILKPVMLTLQSYIMNSAALARHLDTKEFPITCSLLAADVESLYPSIDINRGLDALNDALSSHKVDSETRRFIILLTRWVLMNNITEFNDKLYIQKRGTAMGTPCAVVFACIFMGTIERKAWTQLGRINIHPLLNYRFIDDLLIIVNSSEEAQTILDTFNNIDPFIKLTGNISDDTANFLDLTLYKGSRFHHSQRFDLDVYQKPSNLFLFLPPCSCHPEHVFKGWIQGYLSRLRTNCTDDIIHHLRRQQFWDQLLARGYAEVDLSDYFEHNPTRSVLIAKIRLLPNANQTEPSSMTFFKIRHSARTTQLKPILKKALTASPSMLANPSLARQLGNSGTPILAIRNSPNFGKKLITAKLSSDTS